MFSRTTALSIVAASAAAVAFASAATSSTRVAFVATATSRRTRAVSSSSKCRRARRGAAPPPSTTPLCQDVSDGDGDVFLLSFEGTLAATSRTRSWMAVCVALRVWPRLASNMKELGMDPGEFDWERGKGPKRVVDDEDKPHEWLLRKLSVLASITQQGDSSDAMLGCDAVLLSRLLLEEQILDRGRSNGRGGKYGGKFHPAVSADVGEGNRSKVGSRPLTVGELYENWHEIRDMTRGRYPFVEDLSDGAPKKKDPLPKIRQCSIELHSTARREELRSDILPTWQHPAYDILFDNCSGSNGEQKNVRKNTVLLLGHAAQLPWALTTLSTLRTLEVALNMELPGRDGTENNLALNSNYESDSLTMKVVVTTPENARDIMQQQSGAGEKNGDNSSAQPSLLLVVPDSNTEQTQSDMIKRIVQDFDGPAEVKSHGDVFVIHSSLEVLQRCKLFLGDDAPRLAQGRRRCILPRTDTAVTLFLPQWADNVHPTQQDDAEMDPWLNLVGDDQLLELVSGRVVRAPR